MYKTKGEVAVYAFGTGEKTEIESNKVLPWNKENDDWYDLNPQIKKESYDFTCARITYTKLWNKLTNEQKSKVLDDKMSVFKFVERIDIPNPELMMFMYEDFDRPFMGWVSLDDLEKI